MSRQSWVTAAPARHALHGVLAALTVSLALAAPARAEEQRCKENTGAVAGQHDEQGWRLYGEKRYQASLEEFRCSMASHPSARNTLGALASAIQLVDTSGAGLLEDILLWSDVLRTRFYAELHPDDFHQIGAAIGLLEEKQVPIASVEVSSSVGGWVEIDGHLRSRLESYQPCKYWVTRGRHTIRVRQDQFEPFERVVDVAGSANHLAAEPKPTTDGVLDVQDADGQSADIFVDGAFIGKTPRAVRLEPGRYVVWIQSGELGSVPVSAEIGSRGYVRKRLKRLNLGLPTSIAVSPSSAAIELQPTTPGEAPVVLGHGTWKGRLPMDRYIVRLSNDRYLPRWLSLDVNHTRKSVAEVSLETPPEPKGGPSYPFLGVLASYLRGGSLRSGVDAAGPISRGGCGVARLGDPSVSGVMVGPRFEYAFPYDTALELEVGYLGAWTTVDRSVTCSFDAGRAARTRVAATYAVRDRLALQGTFIGAGGSFRRTLPWYPLTLVSRMTVGAVLGAAMNDDVTATANRGSTHAAAGVDGASQVLFSVPFFVRPELGAELVWRGWRLGLTFGLTFFPFSYFPPSGGAFSHDRLGVRDPAGCTPFNATSAACAPSSSALRDERAYGPFLLFSPALSLAYTL